MKLVLHSYSFRAYPLQHVFVVAKKFGWKMIELSTSHFDPGQAAREISAAARLGRHYGVQIYCAGYDGDFLTNDKSARARSIRSVKETIDACAENGIELINGFSGWLRDASDDWRRSGSALAQEKDYERVAAIYRTLGDYARDRGVRISIEVHPNTVHDTIAQTVHLLDLVDNPAVVATPDPGNSFIISVPDRDPAVLDRLSGKFSYFHLKNCMPRHGRADFNVDTANGVIDNFKWLAKLVDLGIPAMCAEYCGEGDPHPHIRAALEYIQATLELASAVRDDPACNVSRIETVPGATVPGRVTGLAIGRKTLRLPA